jgi:hypothetical protein
MARRWQLSSIHGIAKKSRCELKPTGCRLSIKSSLIMNTDHERRTVFPRREAPRDAVVLERAEADYFNGFAKRCDPGR